MSRARTADPLRNESISIALRDTLAAPAGPARERARNKLFGALGQASGLPGTRMNTTLAMAFATECAAHGKKADALAFEMARLEADVAPGATELEFLPVCGVLALGARAALDVELRPKALALLHEAAEDLRFRVREAVPLSLSRVGEKAGDALVREVVGWMDGYFQGAAVLLALAEAPWLTATSDADAIVARLDEAYQLARNAPRSASRYPGHKALVEALALAPGVIATRHGVVVFDMLARWANTEMPELRDAIAKSLQNPKLAGRHATDIARVRAALDASVPPPRDPTIIVHGTRGRGKKRGRGR